jgi:hypothetical protein
MYLVFSVFTSRPASLLASIEVRMFFLYGERVRHMIPNLIKLGSCSAIYFD